MEAIPARWELFFVFLTVTGLRISTLADYVSALGGHIEVNAVFDDDVVPLGFVEKDRGSVAA